MRKLHSASFDAAERLQASTKLAVTTWVQTTCPEKMETKWITEVVALQGNEVVDLLRARNYSSAVTLILITAALLGDTFLHIIVVVTSFSNLSRFTALAQAGLLLLSLIAQAVQSIIIGQSWQAVVLSMAGLKPVLDAYNEITHQRRPLEQKVSHSIAAGMTRATKVAFELVPLGLFQLGTVLSEGRDQGVLLPQVFSLSFSVVALAFVGAQTNRMLDTNAASRIFDPKFFCIYPPKGAWAFLIELGDTMLIGGYCIAKLFALTSLALTAPVIAGIWSVVDCGMMFAWRRWEGEWRLAVPGLDNAESSLYLHAVQYLHLLVYPMHIARLPGFGWGPQRYSIMILGNLLLINPCQLALGLWLPHSGSTVLLLSPSTLAWLWVAATLAAVCGGLLLLGSLSPSSRETFYKQLMVRDHILDFHWNTKKTAPLGEGHDAARSQTIITYAPCYLPETHVQEWLADKWLQWEEQNEPPEFFTEYWRSRTLRYTPHLMPEEVFGVNEQARRAAQLQRLIITAELGTDVEMLAEVLPAAKAAGVSAEALKFGNEWLIRAKEAQEQAKSGAACRFWLLDADFIRNCAYSALPVYKDLKRDHPEALKSVKLTMADACSGAYRHNILAVSHRWETTEVPDVQGAQMEAIRDYLAENRNIEYVFFDYTCMPQGEKSAAEKREFRAVLPNINLLYLGASVLALMDLSYMSRFWTQFEAWLSFQMPTRNGLVSAPPLERRCTVRCIHNAPASQEQQLARMWAGMTAKSAHAVLSQPDVVVTNQSDKDTQLPKLLQLDQMVADCMAELELGLESGMQSGLTA